MNNIDSLIHSWTVIKILSTQNLLLKQSIKNLLKVYKKFAVIEQLPVPIHVTWDNFSWNYLRMLNKKYDEIHDAVEKCLIMYKLVHDEQYGSIEEQTRHE